MKTELKSQILWVLALIAIGQWVLLNPAFSSTSAKDDLYRVENTYGVETLETERMQFYVSPFANTHSLVGNETFSSSSNINFGIRAGLLLSEQFSLTLGYTKNNQGLSLPQGGNSFYLGNINPNEVMSLKQNLFDAQAKLFWFGRAKRFRPYLSAGLGYQVGQIGYSDNAKLLLNQTAFYLNPYRLKQAVGMGGVGIETALSKAFVLDLGVSLQGVMSYWGEGNGDDLVNVHDLNKLIAASSLSRTASYTAYFGLGVYL